MQFVHRSTYPFVNCCKPIAVMADLHMCNVWLFDLTPIGRYIWLCRIVAGECLSGLGPLVRKIVRLQVGFGLKRFLA
jgi:hypothetical protein